MEIRYLVLELRHHGVGRVWMGHVVVGRGHRVLLLPVRGVVVHHQRVLLLVLMRIRHHVVVLRMLLLFGLLLVPWRGGVGGEGRGADGADGHGGGRGRRGGDEEEQGLLLNADICEILRCALEYNFQ